MNDAELLIIGGGQAGLATAYVARQAGLAPVVLDAGPEPVGSWPSYYDSLTLFSPARYSELPGRRFPGDPDHYPARDEVVEYLRSYAADLDAEIRRGQRVETVARADRGLAVTTSTGERFTSGMLVAATGGFGTPYLPELPGVSRYDGDVLHSSEYRAPERFAGLRVIVVGAGNSAVQIAIDLARVARVTLASRAPVKFRSQRPLGRDIHWWLDRSGLDTSPIAVRLLRGKTTRVLDDGRYRAALTSGNPDRRPVFEALDGESVVWSDGSREPVDAVILATGFRPSVGYLADIGALDPTGAPLHRAGVSTTIAGLGYVGLPYQRSHASATIRGVGADAERVLARLLAHRRVIARRVPGRTAVPGPVPTHDHQEMGRPLVVDRPQAAWPGPAP